jgi:flagellar basal body-associated protein FliL
MKIQKKKLIIICIVCAVVLSLAVCAGFFAHNHALKTQAKNDFQNELSRFETENYKLEKKRSELKDSVSETELDIENKNEIGREAEEYAAQLDSVSQELEEASQNLEKLNTSIEKKQEYIKQAGSIKSPNEGEIFSVSSETLSCPSDIAAGRYIAEGSGNLLIYSTANKLRISENLTSIETNSFTFDIVKGESVKVTDSITFTELN